MKQIISRIKMSRAMAHMRPMNHPWVAMSTCLLATAREERARLKMTQIYFPREKMAYLKLLLGKEPTN